MQSAAIEENALRMWARTFLPYQRRWLAEQATIALAIKARQIGFSHTTAAWHVMRALTEGSTNIIISASQSLSDEVLGKVKAHCRVLRRFGCEAANPVQVSASRVTFANGGRIISLPSSPRTARSWTGHVTFDEAAYHNDLQAVWDAAAAMASRGSHLIRIVSTPNGAVGPFYQWATRPPSGWAIHRVTIEQAQREGMRVDLGKLWDLAGHDERVFAQWHRCQFLDADMQFVPTAFADRALNWTGTTPRDLLQRGRFFAGLDVGRENDLTVLTVAVEYDGKAFVLPPWTCKRTAFAQQKDMVREVRERFPWEMLHIDATGLGMQLAEELVEELGEDETVAVNFTNPIKNDLATRALKWFRDDKMRFPRGREGQELHRETCEVRRIVTNAGNVVYEVPRTRDGHGDRWWSMCLALKGLGEPQTPRGMGREPLLAVA